MCLTNTSEARHPTVPSMRKKPKHTMAMYPKKKLACERERDSVEHDNGGKSKSTGGVWCPDNTLIPTKEYNQTSPEKLTVPAKRL